MAGKHIPQMAEVLDIGDIRNDIKEIFSLLRQIKDDIAQNNTRLAVHDLEIRHAGMSFDEHLKHAESINTRLTRIEELRLEAKGFIYGMGKGSALMLAGGGGAVAAAVSHLISLLNGSGHGGG